MRDWFLRLRGYVNNLSLKKKALKLRHLCWPPLKEVVVTVAISNFSLVFLVFAYMLHTDGAKFSLDLTKAVILANVSSSEVLVYLLAIFAPTIWVMVSDWRARKHSSFFFMLLFIQFLLLVGSAYIFGASKYGELANSKFSDSWALFCLICGLVIWYVTLIYKRLLPSILSQEKREQSGDEILRGL